jgi:hypothetical protein
MVEKTRKQSYLISVSNRENLELCEKYALAGFTNSRSGVWTFEEVEVGDFISFLYGAKAHNLYKVKEKVALLDADKAPPWKPITFSLSKRTYFFPFQEFIIQAVIRHRLAEYDYLQKFLRTIGVDDLIQKS